MKNLWEITPLHIKNFIRLGAFNCYAVTIMFIAFYIIIVSLKENSIGIDINQYSNFENPREILSKTMLMFATISLLLGILIHIIKSRVAAIISMGFCTISVATFNMLWIVSSILATFAIIGTLKYQAACNFYKQSQNKSEKC